MNEKAVRNVDGSWACLRFQLNAASLPQLARNAMKRPKSNQGTKIGYSIPSTIGKSRSAAPAMNFSAALICIAVVGRNRLLHTVKLYDYNRAA